MSLQIWSTQSDRKRLRVREDERKWNVRQETKGNTDLGLSVQFCGVIWIETAALRTDIQDRLRKYGMIKTLQRIPLVI